MNKDLMAQAAMSIRVNVEKQLQQMLTLEAAMQKDEQRLSETYLENAINAARNQIVYLNNISMKLVGYDRMRQIEEGIRGE